MKEHPSQWIASGLMCREVADRMSEYLDDRLPMLRNVRVGLHLASCSGCRAYLRQLTLVSGATRLLERPLPSAINRLRLRRHFMAQHAH